MRDVRDQLQDYWAEITSAIADPSADRAFEERVGAGNVRPVQERRPTSRWPAWATAAAGFAAVLVFGGVALLVGISGDSARVADEGPVVTEAPAVGVPASTVPSAGVSEGMTLATDSFSLEAIAPADPPVDAGPFGEVTWQPFRAPGHLLNGVIATAHGFAASSTTSMRTTTDGLDWTVTEPPIDVHRFAVSGDDLYALGAGAIRLTWTGTAWEAVDELSIPDPGPEILSEPGIVLFAERMAFGEDITVMTARSRVFFSTDGHTFVPAQRGPDPGLLPRTGNPACNFTWSGGWDGEGSIGPVFSTGNGFVALTAGHPSGWNDVPMCRPVIWTSEDGSTWDLVSTESPFGPEAYVRDMAEHDGRIVAVGGRGESEAVMWASDDGLTWTEIPPERISGTMTSPPYSIGAGEAGWVALHGDAPVARVMYSLDGLNWVVADNELPDFEWAYGAPSVAVGSDRILVIFGTIVVGEITQ